MTRSPAQLAVTLLLPLAGLLAGCSGGEPRSEVHRTRGSLMVNGKPAEGAILSFHPADGKNFDQRGSRPRAVVEADGSFAVSTYGDRDGAPAGDYAVSVVWLENADSADPADKLGGRFATPQQSRWRVQIQPGDNQLEPYEITGVRLKRSRPPSAAGESIDPEE